MPKQVDITDEEQILIENAPEFHKLNVDTDSLNLKLTDAFFLEPKRLSGFDKISGKTKARMVYQYEVVLFLEDGGKTIINQQEYCIKKGNIRFLRPGDIVYNYRYNDAYVVHFLPVCENENTILCNKYTDAVPTMMSTNKMTAYIQIFKDLIRAKRAKSAENVLYIKYKLLELIYLLYADAVKSDDATRLGKISVDMVEKACGYIDCNFQKKIQLADMSKSVHLHPNYFHRIFKKCKGITPHQYLIQKRLDCACDMLIGTTKSVTEISELCGFESSSYFISVFKSYCSKTPSEYRTAMQNEYIIKM